MIETTARLRELLNGPEMLVAPFVYDCLQARIAEKLDGMPLLYNGALLPIRELARYGFNLTIHTGSLMAAYVHFRDALRQLNETGVLDLPITGTLFRELIELMGVPETEALSKKYSD